MKKDENTHEQNLPEKETTEDLKQQAQDPDAVKKGYNEKNPSQREGAFTPDAVDNKTTKED